MKKVAQNICPKTTRHLFEKVRLNPRQQSTIKGGIIIEEIIDS